MKATFVRARGQRDRIYVTRTDGSETSWPFPTYGDFVPHDLVHIVVESAFGLRRGFWGLVDAGIDPAKVNAEVNRTSGPDRYRGFGEDRRELLLAEALAGVPWTNDLTDDEQRRESIARNCAQFGFAVPAELTPQRMSEIVRVVEALAGRWKVLPDGGAITLAFDSVTPERGFEALRGGA